MLVENEVNRIRNDFPILKRKVRDGKQLVYLDNAATTQKPQIVIDSLASYYAESNSNIHRGIHALSEIASEMYDTAHQKVSDLLNAKFEEVVFLRNTTEAMNVFARGVEHTLQKGDEIALTRMEHHSNMVPFFSLAKRVGAIIKYIDLSNKNSEVSLESAEQVITDKTKILSFPQMSNALGTINPVKELVSLAREHETLVAIDGAQSVPHMAVDVKALDVDFLGFSGHKMLAPMGIGAFYGKEELLQNLEPLIHGGDMILSVSYEDALWNELPWKFEGGTPNVGGGIALGVAVDYLQTLGMEKITKIEKDLTQYALDELREFEGIQTYGPETMKNRGGIISFNLYNDDKKLIHPHDVSELLDEEGIAIRAGHHCAQPLTTQKLQVPATNRMSFYIYNTPTEIDHCITQLRKIQKLFS